MNVREKIKAAEKSTDVIIDAWHTAESKLTGGVSYNGLGILSDRITTMTRIWEARAALDKAIAAYETTAWPTTREYEEVES